MNNAYIRCVDTWCSSCRGRATVGEMVEKGIAVFYSRQRKCALWNGSIGVMESTLQCAIGKKNILHKWKRSHEEKFIFKDVKNSWKFIGKYSTDLNYWKWRWKKRKNVKMKRGRRLVGRCSECSVLCSNKLWFHIFGNNL